MSIEFASAGLTAGQLNAIVKKLGGHDMALRFLRDELSVSESTRSWRKKDGIIYYFSVTSDGTTGEDWIKRLESNGFRVGGYAKDVLRSSDFKPTSGVTTEVAVLNSTLFANVEIHVEADKRKLKKPNAEVACLIREKFTDKEIEAMGFWWIVVMHEPIKDPDGDPNLLSVNRHDEGCWLNACFARPSDGWGRAFGFAFAVSQVSSQY